jgi:hypothetical protein
MSFGALTGYGFGNSGSGGGGGGTPVNFISLTKAEADALIAGSTLVPGSFYKITDRGDLGILLQAISANAFSVEGVRYMLCPATYAPGVDGSGNDWLGVWNNNNGPTVGQLCIWGGLVWRSINGTNGSPLDQEELDPANWAVIAKDSFTNVEYIPLNFGVLYDYANDWIAKQWDKSDNVFGISFQQEAVVYALGFNPCDISDWNMATTGSAFTANVCYGIFNNSLANGVGGPIYQNKNNGFIYANEGGSSITDNTNSGSIYSNNIGSDIYRNSNNGDINANENTGSITDNSNNGSIVNNSNSGDISSNKSNGTIGSNNGSVTNIMFNTNDGNITGNSNTGVIRYNSNKGNIASNSNTGIVEYNSNNGVITTNTNLGDISANSNDGIIDQCGNNGSISNNSNAGAISVISTNTGNITLNRNNGVISNLDNFGDVSRNSNNGDVTSASSNMGEIVGNVNNGSIVSNDTALPGITITFNTNNGLISNNSWLANVTDPIVDKT